MSCALALSSFWSLGYAWLKGQTVAAIAVSRKVAKTFIVADRPILISSVQAFLYYLLIIGGRVIIESIYQRCVLVILAWEVVLVILAWRIKSSLPFYFIYLSPLSRLCYPVNQNACLFHQLFTMLHVIWNIVSRWVRSLSWAPALASCALVAHTSALLLRLVHSMILFWFRLFT